VSIAGQRVLVVGGTSGIGRATAARCQAVGARVSVAARRADGLRAVHAELGVATHQVDITRAPEVDRMAQEVGEVDHLAIPGSSGAVLGPFPGLDLEAAARAFLDSKLLGPARVAQRVRVRAGGSITFFSGAASRKVGPGGSLVSAVNAAVEALGATLALELAPIRVNVVAPGLTDTPVWDTLIPEGHKADVLGPALHAQPLKRLATPDEVAHAVQFLMENAYVTGEVLLVDGGYARS
jgi:NAD(P)-dependent dehydrogenase (short-subunit alcohol dehydrogenase family)